MGDRQCSSTQACGEESDLSGLKRFIQKTLGRHQTYLERARTQSLDPFSLVVVDEAHRASGKHANDEQTLNANSSQMYDAISELCKAYATKTIGITASPLSMQLSEIHNIAKMLDVHPNLYNHIPLDLSEDEEKETLYEWAEYSVEIDGFIGNFSNGQADEEKSIIELHEFFADSDNKLVSLLPALKPFGRHFLV